MALQDQLSEALAARGIKPLSWRPPEPVYDLAFELQDTVVVVEVKTHGGGGVTQQKRLGIGQLVEYLRRMTEIHGRPVHGALLTPESPGDAWAAVLDSVGLVLIDGEETVVADSAAKADRRLQWRA